MDLFTCILFMAYTFGASQQKVEYKTFLTRRNSQVENTRTEFAQNLWLIQKPWTFDISNDKNRRYTINIE